jgi:hypothetical protein
MKDVLSLLTLTIAALCFAVFVAMVKPLSAVLAPSEPANCIMASSAAPACDSKRRGPYFTGRSGSRSISELPSNVSSDPTIERKSPT